MRLWDIYIIKCQVSGFWGKSPDFAPRLPLVLSPHGGRRNLRIFRLLLRITQELCIISLKVTNYLFLQQLRLGQLIGTYMLKITTDDSFGSQNKQ